MLPFSYFVSAVSMTNQISKEKDHFSTDQIDKMHMYTLRVRSQVFKAHWKKKQENEEKDEEWEEKNVDRWIVSRNCYL